jgi:nucleoside-diphosphate-sugar epimerase
MSVALVTGAGGFIGSALCERLRSLGWQVRAVGRGTSFGSDRSVILCDDLAAVSPTRLDDWLDGVDVVYHLAGRAHRDDRGPELERYELYRRDNVATTRLLFAAAQRNSVARFIYLSSIKVLGDVSEVPLNPDDEPDPKDVYAQTKLEAERYLEDARRPGATQVTIVRPPLVYGPGVKGNFAALLAAVASGLPLPLGRADAPRSLIARSNLVDLLTIAARDTADWRILHARDDGDCTVRELVTQIARAFGHAPRLVPVPRRLMRMATSISGREALFQRLFEPLVIADDQTRTALGWTPALPQSNAIDEVIDWWRSKR